MKVKVWLIGDDFDLRGLADQYTSGDIRVVKDDARYAVMSTLIDNRPRDTTVHQAAQKGLLLINGLARASNPGFRPISLDGGYDDPDGPTTVTGIIAAQLPAIRVRFTGVVSDSAGTPLPADPPPGPRRVALATTDPDVAEALSILGQPSDLGWIELYKVYEIVRGNLGGATSRGLGAITAADHSAFKASANRPDVSGGAARHARMQGARPRRTFTIDEGRAFINRLVTAWMDHLSSSSDVLG